MFERSGNQFFDVRQRRSFVGLSDRTEVGLAAY